MLPFLPRRFPLTRRGDFDRAGRRPSPRITRARLVCTALALVLSACSHPTFHVEPVPRAASEALAEARALERGAAPGWRDPARALAEVARAAAPDWVVPQRFLDDLARSDLLGPAALATHLEHLAVHPSSAAALYLAGRLEGQAGVVRFSRASQHAPSSPWPHHGRAWMRFQAGDASAALPDEDLAIAWARDPYERSHFRIAKSSQLVSLDRRDAAIELLAGLLGDAQLAALDRDTIRLALAGLELRSDEETDRGRGFWRGIELLRTASLPGAELGRLLVPMLAVIREGLAAASLDELEAALASDANREHQLLRARLFFKRGDWPLALELFEDNPSDSRLREALLYSGTGRELVEHWRSALPEQVLDPEGLPKRAALRELVLASRATEDPAGRERLARAMLAAGWFQEARGVAAGLARDDLTLALELDGLAVARRSILTGIASLVALVDEDLPYGGPRRQGDESPDSGEEAPRSGDEGEDSGTDPEAMDSLDELLAAIQPLIDRHLPDGEHELGASPSLELGPLTRVIHPGPRFDARDELAGRGSEGEPVPGLARVLAELGRFGVFGSAPGMGGPDGTILRLLHAEEKTGSHLGVPFAGTVAWCEGADLRSRPGRLGASIAGAALHEGYWIDVEQVRVEWRRWHALEQAFFAGVGERAQRALAVAGPLVPTSTAGMSGVAAQNAAEQSRIYAPLGESERIRLAVLRDRRAVGSSLALEELLAVTAAHEEGHLTDRTRYLPLSEHPFGALALLARAGFSARNLTRLLEYRAQLVALCVVPDPRIPLAGCVDAADGRGEVTVHGAAYRELLGDFLLALGKRQSELEALDGERYLIHQLHRLQPEEIRGVALVLARAEGLIAD